MFQRRYAIEPQYKVIGFQVVIERVIFTSTHVDSKMLSITKNKIPVLMALTGKQLLCKCFWQYPSIFYIIIGVTCPLTVKGCSIHHHQMHNILNIAPQVSQCTNSVYIWT